MGDVHTNRARAELFGTVAGDYDRYRPGYPPALIDDLVGLGPRDVLDAGCGTGKAGSALYERGLSVIGVEPDPRMAAVAASHGLPVEVAKFEEWDAAGRQFDLIVCGQAWHWIDPVAGAAKAAALVRPGGAVARFWNYHVIAQPLLAEFDAVYDELAPEVDRFGHEPEPDDDRDPLVDVFASVEERTYVTTDSFDADRWTALVATFSHHQLLGAGRLSALQAALRRVIDRAGGTFTVRRPTYFTLVR